jgi:hypothetical protein
MDSFLDLPVVAAPPGQVNNLKNPPNHNVATLIGIMVCLVVTTAMAWIRIYVSGFITKHIRWDDWLVILAWLLSCGLAGVGVELVKNGMAIDLWNLSLREYQIWARWTYVALLAYSVTLCCIKVVVLVLYKRIFVPPRLRGNRTYWAIMTIIGFNVMYYTANLFATTFSCTPIQRFWLPLTPGTCVDISKLITVAAGLNVLSDAFILIIPLAVAWNLNMPRKRKAEMLGIFACGGL